MVALLPLKAVRSASLVSSLTVVLSVALTGMGGPLLTPSEAGAQGMLAGCQLIDGALQCVPGLSADPEQQIQILRRTIRADQAIESTVRAERAAVTQVLLAGPAVVGAVLTATVADGSAPVYHWYRLAPADQTWRLIPEAKGATYVLSPADAGQQIMVISVSGSGGSPLRTSSNPIGPVTAAP